MNKGIKPKNKFFESKYHKEAFSFQIIFVTLRRISFWRAHGSPQGNDLLCDPCVQDRKNVFEFVLGGCTDTKLLNIRVFEESTKRRVYNLQTQEAKAAGVSNCPLCAIGHDANRQKIWKLAEMDADHVKAWSKGGATDESNCQMLCKTHNRAKGNK